MQRKHILLYNQLKESKHVKTTLSLEQQPTLTSHFITNRKYNITDHRQVELTKAIVSFIAGDLLPLSIVDSHEFQRLMEIADSRYQLLSRKHLSKKLVPQRSSELRDTIVKKLEKPNVVCTTIDLWTNQQMRSYFGMTVHYISDWSLYSAMLACSRFRGRHTGYAIAE